MCRVVPGLSFLLIACLGAACGSSTSPSESSRCPVGPYVPLADNPWPCPPAAAIAEIDAEISLQFLDDPTAGTLVCRAEEGSADLTRLQERAYQAMYLMKRLQFDTPLPWTSESLWTWFTSSVRGVQYLRVDALSCCLNGFIRVPAGDLSRTKSFGFPGILGLVHEARHHDKGHTCGNRDVTIAEMGSFGVQYYMALWLADHAIAPPLTDDERRYARQSAREIRARTFCAECGGL